MSKQERKEVARRLKEQIKTTTDPEQLIKLTREYNRVTNPRYGRKPSVKKEESTTHHSYILTRKTGSAVDNLSDGKKVLNYLVEQIEKKRKEAGRELTQAEEVALFESLSAEERAAYQALNNDGAASNG